MIFLKTLFLDNKRKGIIYHLKSLEHQYGDRFHLLSKPIIKHIIRNGNQVKEHSKIYNRNDSLVDYYIVRMAFNYISTGNCNSFQGLLNERGEYIKSHFEKSLQNLRNSGDISEDQYNEWNNKFQKRTMMFG
jgi:hypothetical protein